MDKKEFLEKLEAKKKLVKILPREYEEDINQLKERIVSIAQEDFISSIPKEIREGEKIKLKSREFCIENTESGFYIKFDDCKVKIKEKYDTGDVWSDRVKTVMQLDNEVESELSDILGRQVRDTKDMVGLKMLYECFY